MAQRLVSVGYAPQCVNAADDAVKTCVVDNAPDENASIIEKKKPRIGWVDSLRAIGMVAIILNHFYLCIDMDWKVLVHAFNVPVFFLTAGMFIDVKRFDTCLDYVMHEVKSLLVPYVAICLVNIPLKLLITSMSAQVAWTDIPPMLNGTIIANQGIMIMSSLAAWFIPLLFLTTTIGFCLCRIVCGYRLLVIPLMVLSLAAALWCDVNWKDAMAWHMNMVPYAMFYLLLGYVARPVLDALLSHVLDIANIVVRTLVRIFVGGIGIAIAACGFKMSLDAYHATNIDLDMYANLIGSFPAATVACVAIIIGLSLLLMMMPRMRIVELFGRMTLTTLAFHRIPIAIMEQTPSMFDMLTNSDTAIIVATIGVTVLMFVMSYVVYRFVPFLIGLQRTKARKILCIE